MDDLNRRKKKFSKLLKRLRKKKQFRSARALSLAAKLSVNYVSAIERGEILPRWEIVKKLAVALELNRTEQAEFFAAIDLARKPSDVREVLSRRQSNEELVGVA